MVMTLLWRQTWYQVHLNKRLLVYGQVDSMIALYIHNSTALILSKIELN